MYKMVLRIHLEGWRKNKTKHRNREYFPGHGTGDAALGQGAIWSMGTRVRLV
jgi:hypothetical protein